MPEPAGVSPGGQQDGAGRWSPSQPPAAAGRWSPAQPPAADGPLDLTTSRPETQVPAAAAARALDLSLPDKDAPEEACYTCGALVRRSTLHALLVLRRHRYSDEPVFPSLLEHGRPAGSRPMTPDGRVSVCAGCLRSLMAQWDGFQKDKVVAGQRTYAVSAAGGGPPLGEFVCYLCCLTYSVASLSRLRVAPAPAAGEPCYPEVLRPSTPPGAEGVRAGAVSVCVSCKRKVALRHALQQGRPLPANSRCYRIIEEAVRGPLPAEPAASAFESIRVRRSEVVCLSCRAPHQRDFMAEVRLQSADPAAMHFPELAAQPRPPGAVVGGEAALVCLQCRRELRKQWQAFEASGTPLAGRAYAPRRVSTGSGSEPAADSPRPLSASPPVSGASSPGRSPLGRSSSAGCDSPPVGSPAGSPGVSPPAPAGSPPQPSLPSARSSPPAPAGCGSPGQQLSPRADSGLPPSVGGTSGGTSRRQKRPPDGQAGRAAKRRAQSPPSPKPMSLVAPSAVTAGCYACHQPLEANQAYEVRTEPDAADAACPFFPHLAKQRHLPAPVCSVAVCVFCYHTLADQWARYERLSRKIDPYRREYDTHNFICFVCSVRTYRKRLHVIDVKDFPFLTESHRYPEGALLICNKTKSVVCRDCHGTLNCQFQDYERWNLPVNKREYNWVTRPPPPESPEPLDRPDTVIVRYVST